MPQKKKYIIKKRIIEKELSLLSSQYEKKFFQSQIAEYMGVKPKMMYSYWDKPITENRLLQIIGFFSEYGVELSPEYLSGKTPFRNITDFQNSHMNKRRIKQLDFLHSLGFNFNLGAVVNVYPVQLKQLSKREKYSLEYLIDLDFQELMYDKDFLSDMSLDNGLMLPLQLDKTDFSYYNKGLETFSLEFKNISISVDYVFIRKDIAKTYYGEIDKPIILSLQDFDDYMSIIKKSIYEISDKIGYLA